MLSPMHEVILRTKEALEMDIRKHAIESFPSEVIPYDVTVRVPNTSFQVQKEAFVNSVRPQGMKLVVLLELSAKDLLTGEVEIHVKGYAALPKEKEIK